jgi:hypothetical protein
MRSVNHWREELGVVPCMSKEEALGRFREWRESKKTCQRCEDQDLSQYCPIRLVCQEADRMEEEDARRQSIHRKNGNGEARFEEEGFNSHEKERFEVGGNL